MVGPKNESRNLAELTRKPASYAGVLVFAVAGLTGLSMLGCPGMLDRPANLVGLTLLSSLAVVLVVLPRGTSGSLRIAGLAAVAGIFAGFEISPSLAALFGVLVIVLAGTAAEKDRRQMVIFLATLPLGLVVGYVLQSTLASLPPTATSC